MCVCLIAYNKNETVRITSPSQSVEKDRLKAVQLRDFIIPEKFGIVVLCGYAVFLPI